MCVYERADLPCACVVAREPAKIKEQAGQREPARNARTQAGAQRQPASARLATALYAARDGHVHTGDPSAADTNMSPALR